MSLNTPILFIIFKRPEVTLRVFNAIKQAKPRKLYVSANAPRPGNLEEIENCNKTRNIINTVDWDCQLFTFYREKYLPVELSESSAITWFFESEEQGIILEDDCLPDMTFFQFCDELLEKFKFDSRIGTISGPNTQFGFCRNEYSYYFSRLFHSWGWASWRRVWKGYDLKMELWPLIRDGKYLEDIFEDRNVINYWNYRLEQIYDKPDTWDFQFSFHLLVNNYLNIVPVTNLISNIGHGQSAEHTKEPSIYANMKTEPINFPLSHQPFICRDRKADSYRESSIFSLQPPKEGFHHLIRCIIARIRK